MPNVRIPKAAAPLLVFCRPWPNKMANACFSTHADLVIFAAGLGFRQLRGSPVPACDAFIDDGQPYPIDFNVFKSPGQQLYPLVLLLGLAAGGSRAIVRDDEQLVRMIENCSALGFKELARWLAKTTPEEFHVELAQRLADAAK